MGSIGFAAAVSAAVLSVSVCLSTVGAPALASTQAGVTAFQQGKYEEAKKLLEPEAEKNDPAAMFALGKMYASGTGVEKDLEKAADYFRRASELGHAEAQQSLGSALMLGDGIEQDMIEALKWFIVSARAGNQSAATYGGNVAKFMSRQMQLEARTKATEWQKAFDEKQKKDGQ